MLIDWSALSRGCDLDSSAHKQVKPGVLVVFALAPGQTSWAVQLPLASKWLAGGGQVYWLVLQLWMSVTRSSLQRQGPWGPSLSHPLKVKLVTTLNHWGEAFMQLLHCPADHAWGHSEMNCASLEGHGQCHHFFHATLDTFKCP